jgi:hypothetical protein
MEKSIAFEMIHDVIKLVKIEMKNEIALPTGNWLLLVMEEFLAFSSLIVIVGAIDGTHFDIRWPNRSFED